MWPCWSALISPSSQQKAPIPCLTFREALPARPPSFLGNSDKLHASPISPFWPHRLELGRHSNPTKGLPLFLAG
jgi:hypothetical protein